MTNITNLTYRDIGLYRKTSIKCQICWQPLLYPVLCTKCEFYTCKACLKNDSCCGIKSATDDIPINGRGQIQYKLDRLVVYCPTNSENGCHWFGSRGELINHCMDCEKEYAQCVFGCGQIVSETDIDHLDLCEKFFTDDSDAKLNLSKRYFKAKINEINTKVDILATKLSAHEETINNLQESDKKQDSSMENINREIRGLSGRTLDNYFSIENFKFNIQLVATLGGMMLIVPLFQLILKSPN